MVSARLPQSTANSVDVWAAKNGTTRSDAIRQLVEAALASANGQRGRQERALDDALANTFPASDPVEMEEPAAQPAKPARRKR